MRATNFYSGPMLFVKMSTEEQFLEFIETFPFINDEIWSQKMNAKKLLKYVSISNL